MSSVKEHQNNPQTSNRSAVLLFSDKFKLHEKNGYIFKALIDEVTIALGICITIMLWNTRLVRNRT